ncbi:MAG: VCBS repeat-containing protein [Bacteroidia bacterium]|nr:VCBS repeat-containing protein [Bacteroidia bacterium]
MKKIKWLFVWAPGILLLFTSPLHAQNMPEVLQAIEKVDSFPANPFNNLKGIKYWKNQYELANRKKKSQDALNTARLNLGLQYSLAGKGDSAALYFYQISDPRLSDPAPENSAFQAQRFTLLAMAAFGQGQGAEASVQHFQSALRITPNDPKLLWMYNLAHLFANSYPQGLSQTQVIDFQKFQTDNSLQPFKEISQGMGLKEKGHAGGILMQDFNDDGLQDIFTTSMKLNENVRLYLQDETGKFKDLTEKAGLTGITGGCNAIIADYNNDNYPDIYLVRGGFIPDFVNQPNSLLRNNGDGTFTDVTQSSGLLSMHPSHTACFADFNKDGLTDLFVGNEFNSEQSLGDHYCELFLNSNSTNFEDQAKACGIEVNAMVKGAVAFDYDNDGWVDLYLSIFNGPNKLYHNQGVNKKGQLTFVEVAQKAHVAGPDQSWSAVALDINNDGWLDLVVPGYTMEISDVFTDYFRKDRKTANPPKVYINRQDGSFNELAGVMGFNRTIPTMGLTAADLDNDGWMDLYFGTGGPGYEMLVPNAYLRNINGKAFEEVSTTTLTGVWDKTNEIAAGDLDNDGDIDLVLNCGGYFDGDASANKVFLNPGNKTASWINFNLEGVSSNRSAIGAKITIWVKDEGTPRMIHRVVGMGSSMGSAPFTTSIGLGKIESLDKVTIDWPSGSQQIFTDLTPGGTYSIKEGENKFGKIALPKTRPGEK